MGKMTLRMKDDRRLWCRKCRTRKPGDQFPIHPRKKTRRASWCKACYAAYQKGAYGRNHEGKAAAMRRWRRKKARAAGRVPCPCCAKGVIYLSRIGDLQAETLTLIRRAEPGFRAKLEVMKKYQRLVRALALPMPGLVRMVEGEEIGMDAGDLPCPSCEGSWAGCGLCMPERNPRAIRQEYEVPGQKEVVDGEAILAAVAKAGRLPRRKVGPKRDDEIEDYVPELRMEPAPLARRMVGVRASETCPYCQGNGQAANGTEAGEDCAGCQGRGYVELGTRPSKTRMEVIE